jgi:hypothetical protein
VSGELWNAREVRMKWFQLVFFRIHFSIKLRGGLINYLGNQKETFINIISPIMEKLQDQQLPSL